MKFGLLLLFAVLSIEVAIAQPKTGKLIIHHPQFPPFIYLNGRSEQVSGILPELFEPFFRQQKITSRYVFNNPLRAEQALYQGDIDAMFVNPAWLSQPDALIFSDAVLSYDDYLFSLNPEDAVMDLTTARQLRICTREHYIYPELEPYFSQQGFIRVDASSQEAQLKMLLNERCDLAYMNDIIARWLMQQQSQQATLYPLEQAVAKASISLCLHPKWRALLPALNQFILQQQQSGAVQQAVLRHLN